MNAKVTLLIIGIAAALAQPVSSKSTPQVPLPAPAAKVARDFLFAFTRNDREAIADMVPRRIENLYGPSPFERMPELMKPRADTRTGAVDFTGKMADPGLPSKGTIILRLVEEDGVRAWRVRQIYWYTDLPPEADIPDTSPTSADRKQEPALREAAKSFISAWLAKDYQAMDGLTFHWWQVPRKPPKWVEMTHAEVTGRPTTLGGQRVDFVAHLKMARFIPREVQGYLWLVKEDGVWRVRPLTYAFLF